MTSITLHKDRGLNPRITHCPRCGKDGPDIVLLGNRESIFKCSGCDVNIFGHKEHEECPKCHDKGPHKFVRKIGEHEKIPGSLCKPCEDESSEHYNVVRNGGIYFKCEDCNTSGVIKWSSPFAKAFREKVGVKPPNPCGVLFKKDSGCPACGNGAIKDK